MISAGMKQQLRPGEVLIQVGKPGATPVFLVLQGVLSGSRCVRRRKP